MELIDVNKLKPYPKNTYYFDDLDGEPWGAFLESIETSGIIEPIIATQDLTIVSGHQRVRAAKKLGIEKVAVEVRVFDSEDEILKQLLEANLRQRGITNTNQIKFGRCVEELKRLYGIKNGGDRGNQYTGGKKTIGLSGNEPKTMKELADMVGVDEKTLQRATKLSTLPEEVQQLVNDGKVTPSTAVRIIGTLPKDEQIKIAEQIAEIDKEKVGSREVDYLKKRVKALSDENKELRDRKSEVRVVEKEVLPDDYEQLQQDNATLKSSNTLLKKERQKYLDGMNEAKSRIEELEKRDGINSMKERLSLESEYLESNITSFIRNMGGYVWITERLGELPEDKRQNVVRAIKNINAWSQQMITNIGGNIL